VEVFRISAAVAKNDTQIHTHMCYCEFNDIMASIAALDADVITIETSRSDMELLESFEEFDNPNEIGPGVAGKSRSAYSGGAAVGEPGLRPENPRLAGNPRRAGEYGTSRAESASGLMA
jgi:hypothetical protein